MAVEAGPRTITTPADMREQAELWRRAGESIGLVPTMGALHEGHLSLVRRAVAENDRTVVSVFVNPLQFGPSEDFTSYPRTLGADLEALAEHRVDAVYTPATEDMYPPQATTRVRVGGVDEALEGARRPGHLEGVATVVAKLFNATRPHRAYFGQKDAQQAAVITRLAADLDTGVSIAVCPIVRDPDGLALSSRNAYLTPAERQAAPVLYRALSAANHAYQAGERDPHTLKLILAQSLATQALAEPDYAEVVDPTTFRAPGKPVRSLLAVLAVRFGPTRLIDNHLLGDPI